MSQYKKSIVSTENNDKDYSMTVIIVFIGLIIGYFLKAHIQRFRKK